MTRMDDLVQFLRARLDEDTRLALQARDPWFGYEPDQHLERVKQADALFIACYSPNRVLAEVDVKRKILKRYAELSGEGWAPSAPRTVRLQELRDTVRQLALPYADHPDYRDTWRP